MHVARVCVWVNTGGARGTAPRGRGRAGTSFASPSRAVGAAQPSEEDATAGAAGLNADGEPSPLGRVRASPRASTRMSPASRGRTGVVARSGAFSMINDILRSNEGVGQRSPRSTLPPDAEDAADEVCTAMDPAISCAQQSLY